VNLDHTRPELAPLRHDLTFLRRRAARPTRVPVPSATELDLSTGAPRATKQQALPSPRRTGQGGRVGSPERVLLCPSRPTVTLTRVQSGVGSLVFAVRGPAATQHLGCAYALVNRRSGTLSSNAPAKPDGTGWPLATILPGQRRALALDLRQVGQLSRMILFGHTAARNAAWSGGSIVASQFGNGRSSIELRVDGAGAAPLMVLLSLFNVDGELVVRAEAEPIDGTGADACRAYGFDHAGWDAD